jgi:hypothetical protein
VRGVAVEDRVAKALAKQEGADIGARLAQQQLDELNPAPAAHVPAQLEPFRDGIVDDVREGDRRVERELLVARERPQQFRVAGSMECAEDRECELDLFATPGLERERSQLRMQPLRVAGRERAEPRQHAVDVRPRLGPAKCGARAGAAASSRPVGELNERGVYFLDQLLVRLARGVARECALERPWRPVKTGLGHLVLVGKPLAALAEPDVGQVRTDVLVDRRRTTAEPREAHRYEKELPASISRACQHIPAGV